MQNGNQINEVIVVDDFLDDPLAMRNLAISLDYDYGFASSKNANIPQSVRDILTPKIEKIIDSKFLYHERSKFAQMFEGKPPRHFCHVDGETDIPFHWSMLIYLNTDEQCLGGTNLYKHKLSGDIRSDGHGLHQKDMSTPEAWELEQHVEMKFNRAVFIPANRFHCAGVPFGDKPENVRITLNPKLQTCNWWTYLKHRWMKKILKR